MLSVRQTVGSWSGRPSEKLTGCAVSLSRWTARSTMNSAQETRSEVILRSSGSEMAKRYVFGSPCGDRRCVFAPAEPSRGLTGHGNPLQCSSLENPHGQSSLAGCSPCNHKESDTTERLSSAQLASTSGLGSDLKGHMSQDERFFVFPGEIWWLRGTISC